MTSQQYYDLWMTGLSANQWVFDWLTVALLWAGGVRLVALIVRPKR